MFENCPLVLQYYDDNLRQNNIINENNYNINNITNQNEIIGILEINLNEIKKNTILFRTKYNNGIDVFINNKRIDIIKDENNHNIYYKFNKDGIYKLNIIFNNNITTLESFFEDCINLISLNIINLNSLNTI